MKVIVVCNQKGGVGKTLIADELAFSFERTGHVVSFLDLDRQGGALHEDANRGEDSDVVVIDTPGALTDLFKKALDGADMVVVPVRASSRDIPPFLRTKKIIETLAPHAKVIYVLNAWNRNRACADFLAWLKKEVGGVLGLPQAEAFVQAGVAGKSVVEFAKGSVAADATLRLCNAVRSRLGFAEESGVNDGKK